MMGQQIFAAFSFLTFKIHILYIINLQLLILSNWICYRLMYLEKRGLALQSNVFTNLLFVTSIHFMHTYASIILI